MEGVKLTHPPEKPTLKEPSLIRVKIKRTKSYNTEVSIMIKRPKSYNTKVSIKQKLVLRLNKRLKSYNTEVSNIISNFVL